MERAIPRLYTWKEDAQTGGNGLPTHDDGISNHIIKVMTRIPAGKSSMAVLLDRPNHSRF